MDEPWVIIVLLGLVVFTFAWIQHKTNRADKPQMPSEQLLKEMEDAFEHFAGDIEEDNRKVIEYVAAWKERNEKETRQLRERLDALEQALAADRDARRATEMTSKTPASAMAEVPAPPASAQSAVAEAPSAAATGPSAVESNLERTERFGRSGTIASRYKPIFDLHAEGKSVEYIAKKVGMNKGEVQLILTLSGQEEASRAEK